MAEPFDAYHKWLGIPPAEQPPHYYRLLGIPLFESDADVIANAADKQMVHLRSLQAGRRAALSQKMLNEIAAARVCLLNREKKAAYDAALREKSSGLPTATPLPNEDDSSLDLESVVAWDETKRPSRRRRKKSSLQPVAAIAVAILALLGIGYYVINLNLPLAERPVVKPRSETAKRTEKPQPEPVKPAAGANHAEPKRDAALPTSPPRPVAPPPINWNDRPAVSPEASSAEPPAEPPADAERRLKQALAAAKTSIEYRTVADGSLKAFARAAAAGETELSKRLATMALVAARKSRDDALAEDAVVSLLTGKRQREDAYDEAEEQEVSVAVPSLPGAEDRPSVRPSASGKTFLSDLSAMNVHVDGGWFSNKPSEIFMHPSAGRSSSVDFQLDGRFRVFHAKAAILDRRAAGFPKQVDPASPLTFEVWGDGQLLWRSHPLSALGQTSECRVSVRQVAALRLVIVCPGASNWAYGGWRDGYLER